MSNPTVYRAGVAWAAFRRALQVVVLLAVGLAARSVYAGALAIMPPSATVSPGGTQMFTATGGSGMGYVWTLTASPSGGNITAAGLYTAGMTSNVVDKVQVANTVTISPDAGSDAAPTMMTSTATAAVTVGSGVSLMPVSATVAPGGMQTFIASGGTPPYTWSLTTDGSGPMAAVSAMGVYTAGATAGMDAVTATDSVGSTATADITVSATPVMMVGIGASCMTAASCPAGASCVDGVCCTTGCGGQCQACNTASSMGTCVTISGPPVGLRPPCAQSDPNNACTSLRCDGTSATSCTSLVGTETSCGIASCVDGIGTPGAVCQGDGGCEMVVPKSCGVYGCVSDKCATSCIDTSECSPGNYCEVTTGKCVRPPASSADAGPGGAQTVTHVTHVLGGAQSGTRPARSGRSSYSSVCLVRPGCSSADVGSEVSDARGYLAARD